MALPPRLVPIPSVNIDCLLTVAECSPLWADAMLCRSHGGHCSGDVCCPFVYHRPSMFSIVLLVSYRSCFPIIGPSSFIVSFLCTNSSSSINDTTTAVQHITSTKTSDIFLFDLLLLPGVGVIIRTIVAQVLLSLYTIELQDDKISGRGTSNYRN